MIEFEEAAIPTEQRLGRTPMPNPFLDVFPSDDKALTFVVPEGKDSVEARRLTRQARQAGKKVGRTARIKRAELPDGSLQMTVWTVSR